MSPGIKQRQGQHRVIPITPFAEDVVLLLTSADALEILLDKGIDLPNLI